MFSLLALAALPLTAQTPDAVFHNGKVVTVDSAFTIVQAFAVTGGRITATGSSDAVLKLAGPRTNRVDLRGRTVLPGLMDTHVHAVESATWEFDHKVPEMETIADVLAYVRSRAAALKPGEWILLSQIFITRLRDQRFPTRAELDQAAPRNPVVFRTGPDASLNSPALKASGIDRNFKITDGQPGRIERDASGEPTGIIRSGARFIRYTPSTKQPAQADKERLLKQLLADYNSVGLTSIADRDTSDSEVAVFRAVHARGELTTRVFLNLSVDAQAPLPDIEARIRRATADPLHKPNQELWLRGIKTYLDGGMLTGSAYMLKPWGVSKVYSIDDPAYRGMRYIEPEKLYQIARLAIRNGLQPTSHSVGDGAVTALVDAYERVNEHDQPVREARPSITHSNFMTLEAIRRMKRLGIVADIQPIWFYLDGATLLKQFGNERMAFFQPYKTLFDEGVMVGGGSDHMQKIGSLRSVNPYNPWLGMWMMLAREPRWMTGAVHPEQRVTREQAIRFYTINNAFLTFAEKEKGSLEAGKLADFILLDRDVLTVPLEQVRQVQVDETWLGGRRVYARKM
ncbi:MAG: amidohydrolase [Acidobacteria bacterium]|nr:amidohydrolase [Acidobacteriota bacterium]